MDLVFIRKVVVFMVIRLLVVMVIREIIKIKVFISMIFYNKGDIRCLYIKFAIVFSRT